jgi:hypothetical protein
LTWTIQIATLSGNITSRITAELLLSPAPPDGAHSTNQTPEGESEKGPLVKRLILLVMLMTGASMAQDLTPYKFAAFGNIYGTPGGVNHHDPEYMKWFTARFDMVLNGAPDWLDGLRRYDVASPTIMVGPYASSQEINMYEPRGADKQYGERLQDVARHWQYIFARDYLLGRGISEESLVVHIADDQVSIVQDGDGGRTYGSIQSLPLKKRRFTYQYWNNTPSDTAFYPGGYVWMANGWNPDARAAIADAYYRAFIAEPQRVGWPSDPWDVYYMDNQGRAQSFLAAYWSLSSSSGGSDPGVLEWLEGNHIRVRQNGGGPIYSSALDYFDNSTRQIDKAIKDRLEPYGVRGMANVDMGNPEALSKTLPYVSGVCFESYLDPYKPWGTWHAWLSSMDTMAVHPDKMAFMEYRGDFLCSTSGWKADTSRIMMAGYAFFLITRTPNTYFGPHSVHQGDFGGNRRCWQKAFTVNIGEATGHWRKIDSTGYSAWGDKTMVLYRSYGPNAVIFRTGYNGAPYDTDSIAVNLHGLYRLFVLLEAVRGEGACGRI